MKRLLLFLVVLISLTVSPRIEAQRGVVTYNGTYSSGTTYHAGDMVTTPSGSYVSIVANNTGHAVSNTTYWSPMGAESYQGTDIGAKINAAFAFASGTSGTPAPGAVVDLPASQTYSYTTTITIPNSTSSPYIYAPVLDCHGSTLTYTGSGSAMTILGENGFGTGEIRNCIFSATNSAATITAYSRINFSVRRSSFYSLPILFINDLAHGGPGYFEENHWSDIELNVASGQCGMTFEQASAIAGTGLGSFFYNFFEGMHLDLNGSSSGFCFNTFGSYAEQPVSFGSNFQIHVNTGGTGNSVFNLQSGTNVSRGTVVITGENTGVGTPQYDVYVAGSATFYNQGFSYASGLSHGYASGVPTTSIAFLGGLQPVADDVGTGNGTMTLSGEPGGTNAGRQCKTVTVGGNTAFLMASYGGVESDCFWEVAYRNTSVGSTYPDVDIAGASGNPITSILFTEPLTHNIGIGPGFSEASNVVSGTDISKPQSTAEVRGTLTVRNPSLGTIGNGGATGVRSVDSSGNITDFITSGISGQPTNHYELIFYDYKAYAPKTALDCHSDVSATCSVSELTLVPSATTCSSATAGRINYVQGATGVKDTVQVCAKDATNAYAYRTIY